ncbi:MAG TPA: hypothetical protein DCE44_09355, partial [Verrucomicrobiales bacterium]|nr:hypothetical protein [Verrucomicrobiales bacterium]
MHPLHQLGCGFALVLLLPARAAVDYLREVKPLLTEHCVSCHDGAHQKSGLRLDTAAGARRGGDHGPALTPGRIDLSLIIQVLEGEHPELAQMPYKKPALSPDQIEKVRQWIGAGAEAPKDEQPGVKVHWSFVRPVAVDPPAVRQSDWVRNPIDQFILARLEDAGIQPSPEADRITLIRRVSLDLTGLPPTPEDVDAFLSDARSDAYEHLVDRLLASPHYG